MTAREELIALGLAWVVSDDAELKAMVARAKHRECSDDVALLVVTDDEGKSGQAMSVTRQDLYETIRESEPGCLNALERLSQPAPATKVHLVITHKNRLFTFFYNCAEGALS